MTVTKRMHETKMPIISTTCTPKLHGEPLNTQEYIPHLFVLTFATRYYDLIIFVKSFDI